MNRLALLFVALAYFPSGAFASRAYDLSSEPEAVVDEQGVCHITGAIWRNGPERHVRMVLRQLDTGKTFETSTDGEGIYRIYIPVSGRTVFQETNIGRHWNGSLPKAYCIRARVEVGDLILISK